MTTVSTIASMKLVDPTGTDPGIVSWSLSPRPEDLRGKRVGLLDNSKANSDVVLRAIADILGSEFEFSDVFYVKKHSASLPPTPEVMAELHRNADLVITGIGD